MQPDITPEYLSSQGFSETLPNRFWSKVNKNGPIPKHCPELGECWIWTAQILKGGYGSIGRGSAGMGSELAHRVSWILHRGPLTCDAPTVIHLCDNPSCVRPEHLNATTQLQNIRDCINKRRAYWQQFPHGISSLSESQIEQICELYSPRVVTGPMLAKRFNVSLRIITSIVDEKFPHKVKASRTKRHKFDADEVKSVRHFYNNGVSVSRLAEKCDCSKSMIRAIVNGQCWKHI